MLLNINYFILLSGSIIAALSFIFIHKRRSKSLSNSIFVAPYILEAINETVIVTNALNIIVYINQAGEKLLKTSQKEILGKNISEIFANITTQLIPGLSETNIRTYDDEIISASIIINKITNENQKLLGYNIILNKNEIGKKDLEQLHEKTDELAGINNLMEEMKKSKEKEEQKIEQKVMENTIDLREEYIRLLASINNLSIGFIMTDNEKNIIMSNDAAKNLFSMPNIQTNINLQDLQKYAQINKDLAESADYVLKNISSLSFENIHIGNKYAKIFISPFTSSAETIGSVILTEDKTDEKTAEKSKEDFFTIASHELRAPLTAIRGYIAIIKQFYSTSIKNEELSKIISDIDSLSARLINIVNDFLDTPKLEQGKIKVKKEPCEVISIIKDCIKETNSIAVPKNLFINFTNPFNTATVLGDKERIRQVIINLISNGIKYSDQGGITINIEKTPDARYKISINDTGKGIPKENIKILFTKFQQTDPTKRMTSTGLGLYISKLLVEKMNGTIQLENTQEGKGSTFSFTLPVYEQNFASTQTTGVN